MIFYSALALFSCINFSIVIIFFGYLTSSWDFLMFENLQMENGQNKAKQKHSVRRAYKI